MAGKEVLKHCGIKSFHIARSWRHSFHTAPASLQVSTSSAIELSGSVRPTASETKPANVNLFADLEAACQATFFCNLD